MDYNYGGNYGDRGWQGGTGSHGSQGGYGGRSYGSQGGSGSQGSDWGREGSRYGGQLGQGSSMGSAGQQSGYQGGYPGGSSSQQGWGSHGGDNYEDQPGGNRFRTESMTGVRSSSGGNGGTMGNWGSQSQSQSRGQHSGRGPKGYQRSDERILGDVNEALSPGGELEAPEIEVRVTNGEVTLSGTVHERNGKRRAEDVAERCSGVKDVNNQIRVQREQHESDGDRNTQHQVKGRPVGQQGSNKGHQETRTA